MEKAIEKFIDRLGIKLEIKRASNIYYTKGGQNICVLITAHYKGKKNYDKRNTIRERDLDRQNKFGE